MTANSRNTSIYHVTNISMILLFIIIPLIHYTSGQWWHWAVVGRLGQFGLKSVLVLHSDRVTDGCVPAARQLCCLAIVLSWHLFCSKTILRTLPVYWVLFFTELAYNDYYADRTNEMYHCATYVKMNAKRKYTNQSNIVDWGGGKPPP